MPPKAPKKKLHELAVLLPEGTMISDPSKKKDYAIGKQFATGGFGRIYTCREFTNPKVELVIKVEPSGNGPLFTEVNVFQRLLKKDLIESFKSQKKYPRLGLPYIIGGGVFTYREEKLRYLIIPKYDMSLEGLREKAKYLTGKNTWEVTLCVLQSLEYVHEKQFTHADIKAANILLEKKNDCTTSVLVDFGLARYSANNVDKPDKKRAHNGTAIFTSSDAHLGYHPSFRGDIEILAYNILYWLTGSLPWLEFEENAAKVFEKKQAFLKNYPKNLKDLLKTDSESIEALTVFFDVATKTSYVQQVDFKILYNAAKKGLVGAKRRKQSPPPESPEGKKLKASGESPVLGSLRPRRAVAKVPSTPTPRATRAKASSSTRNKSPIKSKRSPDVSPAKSFSSTDSPRRVRATRRSPPLRESPAVRNQKNVPRINGTPIDCSKVTTRRKFVSKPLSPSIKACPKKLLELVPGVRNFEKNRRSLVLRTISRKYQKLVENPTSMKLSPEKYL